MFMTESPLTQAIDAVGLQPLAKACGVTYQALRKWEARGRLPRTEWTGETNYAEKLAAACCEKGIPMTKDQFLVIVPAQKAVA